MLLQSSYLSISRSTGRGREIYELEEINPFKMAENDVKEAKEVVQFYLGGLWHSS